jgi:hypothetical protein
MDWKHLMTATAYQMRLILQDLYELHDVRQARRDFKTWWAWVKEVAAKKGHELRQPMVNVAEMVERHLEGILGHWKDGLTTAYLEGLDSLRTPDLVRQQTENLETRWPPIDREACLRHVPYGTRLRQSALLQGHRFSTASGVLSLFSATKRKARGY